MQCCLGGDCWRTEAVDSGARAAKIAGRTQKVLGGWGSTYLAADTLESASTRDSTAVRLFSALNRSPAGSLHVHDIAGEMPGRGRGYGSARAGSWSAGLGLCSGVASLAVGAG